LAKEYNISDWYEMQERRKKRLELQKKEEKITLIDDKTKTKKRRLNRTPPRGYGEAFKGNLRGYFK
jgi:hypothetical protein